MTAAGMPPIKKPSMTMITASEIGPRISAPNPPGPLVSPLALSGLSSSSGSLAIFAQSAGLVSIGRGVSGVCGDAAVARRLLGGGELGAVHGFNPP